MSDMFPLRITPYRRHLGRCPHRDKGQHYTLCECPIWIYGKLPNGNPVRRTLQTNDWERAVQRLENLHRSGELMADKIAIPHAVTIEKASAEYLEDCRKRNLAESTLTSYTRTMDSLGPVVGNHPVSAVDVAMLAAYFAGRNVKPRTYRAELQRIRAFFSWCRDRKWCTENPAKRIKPPKVDDVATLPFTPEEIEKLLAACDLMASDDPAETPYVRKRARALVLIFLYSGLRISDVTILRRSAFDSATRHLTLRIMKNKTPLKVQLHEDVVDALNAMPAVSAEYFFWTGNGDRMTCTGNLRRTVYRVGKLAKVPARPHRFRDTFAVELISNGADIRTVQMLLGHEDVRTTERHYAHFMPAHQSLLDSATATLDFEPKSRRPILMKPRQNRRRDA